MDIEPLKLCTQRVCMISRLSMSARKSQSVVFTWGSLKVFTHYLISTEKRGQLASDDQGGSIPWGLTG